MIYTADKKLYPLFFFFSSRRRHTRLVSDWSSDVCSSDLPPGHHLRDLPRHPRRGGRQGAVRTRGRVGGADDAERTRSEERRVGKECRSRWSPEHSKEKRSRQEGVHRRDSN